MKAVVAAFNQEKALVGAFSVITNLRMELFEALLYTIHSAELGCVSIERCVAAWCSPAPGQPQRDTAGPRTGFPLLRLGDTGFRGGETVFVTGKYIVYAAKDSVRCVECWCMCRVAVCSAVPGAELCGAVSLVTTPALSLGCQLPLHSPHRYTHRLDTTHFTH